MNKRRIVFWTLGLVVLVALVVYFQPIKSYFKGQPYSPYAWYAVHLQNGQVYFGHLAGVDGETLTIADTFFLEPYTQPGQASQGTGYKVESTPQQIYNLVRRGSGNFMNTDNVLFVDRHTVLFWEKLDKNSEVTKVIQEAVSNKK